MRTWRTLAFLVFGLVIIWAVVAKGANGPRTGDWTIHKSNEAGKVDFAGVTSTASRLYTADYIGAALGARRGELLAMRWSDLQNGYLTSERSIIHLHRRTTGFFVH